MKKSLLFGVIIMFSFIWIVSCDPDNPPSIWNEDDVGNPTPIISSFNPPDSAYSIIEDITITGDNFSEIPTENLVFFDGIRGEVKSASKTELIVKTPDLIGDSINIKIAVHGAYLFAEYDRPFKLKPIAIEYGGFDEYDNIKAIACDIDENIYVTSDKIIYKVKPDSLKKEFAQLLSIGASSMKIGPGGNFYYVQSIAMFRATPNGTSDGWYTIFPKDINDFDFDNSGNLYAGGINGSIYSVDIENKVTNELVQYDSIKISSVRVFDEYLYFAGKYIGNDTNHVKNGIWRNKIVSGTLSAKEQYLIWDEYDDSEINAITFAADGDMYISSTGDDCITVFSNGELSPLYEGAIYPDTKRICWGNGKYLYAIRRKSDLASQSVVRINMQKMGAPYYGRQL